MVTIGWNYVVRSDISPSLGSKKQDCLLNPFPDDKLWTLPKLKEVADDDFKFEKNGVKFSKRVENTMGKGAIAHYEKYLLFPRFSKKLFCRHIKTRACLRKG